MFQWKKRRKGLSKSLRQLLERTERSGEIWKVSQENYEI